MKLEVYGGAMMGGWSAHGEYEPGIDPPLNPCPFCHNAEIEVSNTHTPFFTARCTRCEAKGPRNDEGLAWRRGMGRAATEALHRRSFLRAIDDWNRASDNTRDGGEE